MKKLVENGKWPCRGHKVKINVLQKGALLRRKYICLVEPQRPWTRGTKVLNYRNQGHSREPKHRNYLKICIRSLKTPHTLHPVNQEETSNVPSGETEPGEGSPRFVHNSKINSIRKKGQSLCPVAQPPAPAPVRRPAARWTAPWCCLKIFFWKIWIGSTKRIYRNRYLEFSSSKVSWSYDCFTMALTLQQSSLYCTHAISLTLKLPAWNSNINSSQLSRLTTCQVLLLWLYKDSISHCSIIYRPKQTHIHTQRKKKNLEETVQKKL